MTARKEFTCMRARGDTVHFQTCQTMDDASVRGISNATWVGVAVNVVLAVVKTAGGVLGNSRALIADAVHTISDLATDVVILIGVRYWSAPADAQHPHGHRKIETLITLAIGLALCAVGVGMGYESVAILLKTLAGGETPPIASIDFATWLGFGAAVASIVGKEFLYRWTVVRGIELSSSALVANAWHHRSDALSSIPPALSIGANAIAGRFGYNLWYLDAVGTMIICVMLLHAAWEVVEPTLSALLDASADRKLCSAIRKCVLDTPGVLDTHKIRTRCICTNAVAVDLHIMVRGNLTVAIGHGIAATVKRRILSLEVDSEYKPVDVLVHVEPADEMDVRKRKGSQDSDTLVDWMDGRKIAREEAEGGARPERTD